MPAGSDNYDNYENVEEAVLSAIDVRIIACEDGIDKWWTVVRSCNENDKDVTWHDKISVMWKCQYMLYALREARNMMGVSVNRPTWKQHCCKNAADHMKRVNVVLGTHGNTVMRWHAFSRDHGNTFPHPNAQAALG